MTPEEQPTTTERGTPRSPRRKHRPSILGYLIVLFTAAFLLLLLSYFMQQRRNDQDTINGLQASISAMQSVDQMREENKALQTERDALQKELDEAQAKLAEVEKQLREQLAEQEAETALQQQGRTEAEQTALALDWLWRIEREYFQGRRANARKLIQAFQETGLEQYLPSSPLVDQEYRSPLEQYQAIYNILF